MSKADNFDRIRKVLQLFDSQVLLDSECFLGGGTALALRINEYRNTVDIDFVCSSREGYKKLRNIVGNDNLGSLLPENIEHLRSIRKDANKIVAYIKFDGMPIKIEILREVSVEAKGGCDDDLKVPTLSKEVLYTQKILANADRGLDSQSASRDIIDLAMMIKHWGPIPKESWDMAIDEYGDSALKGFHNAVALTFNKKHIKECFRELDVTSIGIDELHSLLDHASECAPLTSEEKLSKEVRIKNITKGEINDVDCNKLYIDMVNYISNDVSKVRDWSSIERAFISRATASDASPFSIIDTLRSISPASVSASKHESIERKVHYMADDYENNKDWGISVSDDYSP